MSTVETVLLSLLVIDALALITLVLIQQGKGADVGAAFGSGSSNTVFGSSGGATAMTRLTTWLANQVVRRVIAVAPPELPNTVFEEPLPKAAPTSAPLPC